MPDETNVTDTYRIVIAIDRLTDAVKELVTLVGKHAEAAASSGNADVKELLDMGTPPPPATPEKPPTHVPKTDLTAVPPNDALCRCMHQSVAHVDGVGACIKNQCPCQKFNYMVAPKATPGACSKCGCAPLVDGKGQVEMMPGIIPPICKSCHGVEAALKPVVKKPVEAPAKETP